MHVERLRETAQRQADETFLIDAQSGRALTYRDFLDASSRLADELRRRGLEPGDRLALSMTNSAELAITYFAALQSGSVVVPVGSGFGRRELRSILDRTRPRIGLVGGREDRLEEACEGAGVPLVPLGEDGELDPWTLPAPDPTLEPFAELGDGDLVSIHFTSGTTGPPRGVGHRLQDFVGNGLRYAAAAGLDESNRLYCTLPMTYMAGYYNLLLLPFTLGASVVLERAFDARLVTSYWRSAVEHEVDTLWLVPTIMAMLLQVDRDPRGRDLCRERIRFAAAGTAPLDADLRSRFESEYGIQVHDSYGLSETLLLTASTPHDPSPPGAVGAPLPGIELDIRPLAGRSDDGEGAILVSTPEMMRGYLTDSEAEAPRYDLPLVDGKWLDTGDIGCLDADGRLQITGRAKEVIIRGGVNVSPREVEAVLQDHEAVEETAVVSVPHEILGEDVAAVIVCRDGFELDEIEPDLKARAGARLEAAQRPGLYVQIDSLPTTSTGKVRRGALRDLVIDRLGLAPRSKGFTVDIDGAGPRAEEASRHPGGWQGAGRMVDLSHPLREGMTSFPSPNHPRPEIRVLARHESEGRMTRRLVLGTHTGTHLDAPLHFIPEGAAVDALDLDSLIGPAVLADLTPVDPLEEIGVERLTAALGTDHPAHPRLLLRFDWSRRFGDPEEFYDRYPYLTDEACEWLLDKGVVLLGIDTPSPDDPRNSFGTENDSPNHKRLLGRGVILLEYLANLDRLTAGEIFLIALPLPVEGADGAPSRVVAYESRA